ncbi:hypothetical protein RCH09_003494 [Actimicrobium sp. GrIS 1.19]|uniref:hypothetical protein n=1 Tax=Actimicrobium sp. GrIS 1.19 TaxID=3071708 RepID=UPI002DFA12B6|nr:hypothetical protein [Actimicrobium sp. GrIS 1.19]
MTLSDLYREAFTTQRHFDSLSQVAISSIAAVAGGAPLLYKAMSAFPVAGAVFFVAIALLWLAFRIYERFDTHAALALNVAQAIEAMPAGDPGAKPVIDGNIVHGMAHVFLKRGEFPSLMTTPGGYIHRKIRLFVIGATLLFGVLGAGTLYFGLVLNWDVQVVEEEGLDG